MKGDHPRFKATYTHDSLEFGEGADHLHHHAPGGCGGIDGFREATKTSSSGINFFHNQEEVFERPRQTVKFPDHDHIIYQATRIIR